MRQFFKNSTTLIVFFAAISMCIFIAFSFSYIMFSNENEYLTLLSDNAYELQISQSEMESYKNKNLYDFIENQVYNTSIIKPLSFSSGIEAYLDDNTFSIKNGRSFDREELLKGYAVTLISEKKLSDCVVRNQKYYYMSNGGSYEVIGILNNDNIDSIIPLIRVLKDNYNSTVNGSFFIDCGKYTDDVVQSLISNILSVNNKARVSYKKINPNYFNSSAFPDIKIIVLVVIGVIILMTFNLYSINLHWFNGKKYEVYIYVLSGVNDKDIWLKLITNYSILVLIGSIVGTIFSYFFIIMSKYASKFPPIAYCFKSLLIVSAISIIGIVYCSIKLKEAIKTR